MEKAVSPIKSFLSAFKPEIKVSSPGRINLIGEHTDYNNGFVMPSAIDKKIYFEFSKNGFQDKCRVYSRTYDSYFEFNPENILKSDKNWENYLLGVADEILKLGKNIQGFDCTIVSELPIGAGISSSAALECGFAAGLNALFKLGLKQIDIVKLSQRAENNFVGSNCGIMDQFASVMSKDGHFLMLDCASLEVNFIPTELKNCKLLLLNTGVSHNLADSGYNTRRQQCEDSVAKIAEKYPEVKSLRDVSEAMLNEFKNELPEVNFRRCKYVLEENKRVHQTANALQKGELNSIGNLMYASHRGLQHEYEVSCKELDFLVDFSENKDFIYGSRMMGGGFGGCTINLIESDKIEAYTKEVSQAYKEKFNIELEAISVAPSEGTIVNYLETDSRGI